MLIPVHNCDYFLIFHAIAEPHFLPSGLRAVIVRLYPGHFPGFPIVYRHYSIPSLMNAFKGLQVIPAITVPTVHTM